MDWTGQTVRFQGVHLQTVVIKISKKIWVSLTTSTKKTPLNVKSCYKYMKFIKTLIMKCQIISTPPQKKKPHTVIYDTVFVQNVSKSFRLGTVYVHKDYGDY